MLADLKEQVKSQGEQLKYQQEMLEKNDRIIDELMKKLAEKPGKEGI